MTTPTNTRGSLSPSILLLLVVLTGWSGFALLPRLGRRLGVADGGQWFVDSYAVLAASDAVRAGLDPFQPNPLDVYNRLHSYSHWWFVLGDLGFTRKDNFLLGGSWVLAFLAACVLIARPTGWRQALMDGAVLLSPPVLLAVNRANNDLVVFIMLAGGLWFLREARLWRLVAFAALLLLATGLKFYPILAAAVLLLVRPPRRMWLVSAAAALAGVVVLATLRSDLRQAVILAPVGLYTFGVPVIFRDLGWTGHAPLGAGAVLLSLAAMVCVRRGWSVPLDDDAGDWRARCAYACGALLLTGCFLAGISYSYRLIHVVFLLPWLCQQRATPAARWTGGLLVATLWLDGLYCLVLNTFVGPMPVDRLVHLQMLWRFVTQPVAWAAMALLAGSLLNMLLATVRETRKAATA